MISTFSSRKTSSEDPYLALDGIACGIIVALTDLIFILAQKHRHHLLYFSTETKNLLVRNSFPALNSLAPHLLMNRGTDVDRGCKFA